MPIINCLEIRKPDIRQLDRDHINNTKQRTERLIRQWKPTLPIFPKHNIKSTVYNLKKPFYPSFMFEKPDMKKIMTEEYRRMWHLESIKFGSGLDKHEPIRLPRRPYIKYGQFRTFKKKKFTNPARNQLHLLESVASKNCSKFHKKCILEDEVVRFKAKPVPDFVNRKRCKKQQNECGQQTTPEDFDCTLVYNKDLAGNDVCSVQYKDQACSNNYSFNSNVAAYHTMDGNAASAFNQCETWPSQKGYKNQTTLPGSGSFYNTDAMNYNTVCYPGCTYGDNMNYVTQVYNNPDKFVKANIVVNSKGTNQCYQAGNNNVATATVEYPCVYGNPADNNSPRYPAMNYRAYNQQDIPGYANNNNYSNIPQMQVTTYQNQQDYNQNQQSYDIGDTCFLYNNPAYTNSSQLSQLAKTGCGMDTCGSVISGKTKQRYRYPCATLTAAALKEAEEQIKRANKAAVKKKSVGNYPFNYHRAEDTRRRNSRCNQGMTAGAKYTQQNQQNADNYYDPCSPSNFDAKITDTHCYQNYANVYNYPIVTVANLQESNKDQKKFRNPNFEPKRRIEMPKPIPPGTSFKEMCLQNEANCSRF